MVAHKAGSPAGDGVLPSPDRRKFGCVTIGRGIVGAAPGFVVLTEAKNLPSDADGAHDSRFRDLRMSGAASLP
jgi:hypothetical protein